ncbi:hypothetical protein Cgig2_027835 [Carnegiea gigantea]|uniref:Arogenate dehydrogenase n=1 Tax=Carnegiea gigantea TaxID=171969 RepID=A0A9Q1K1L5_9CARY|nr:hypothetical protein Cgig2_027835 [Carnegiea gigantea]
MFSLSSVPPSTAANWSPEQPHLRISPATLSSRSHLSFFRAVTFSSSRCRHRRRSRGGALVIRNIDAAQPYDYESKLAEVNNSYSKLKIAIVGFGNYGQFLAKTLVAQGHTVLAHSRSDYTGIASKLGVAFFSDPHDLCEEHPEVRIGKTECRIRRCEAFLDVFRREGCRVEEMTCAEHDRYAAGSQFITHFVGRILEKLDLEDTPINTKGYESLLTLVDNTAKDSFELFYGLFLYNKNAMQQLERLDLAFELVKQQLFGHLHGLLRKQLFGCAELDDAAAKKETKLLLDGPQNGQVNGSASTPPSNAKIESN